MIPSHPDSVEIKAAERLQHYLAEMSQVTLPIVPEGAYTGKHALYLGKTDYAKALPIDFAQLKDDGYAYKFDGGNFAIAGGAKKGTLYGMYDLLEFLGFRKYTSAYTYVPKTNSIKLPADKVFNPEVVYRTTSYSDTKNPEYADWHKLNSRDDEWGLFVHTFNTLVPPGKYFKTHPEYYALRDRQRQATQLCLSNPDVKKVLVASLKEEISKKPHLKYWSVSQNDNAQSCQCDECIKLDKLYGGDEHRHSGSMIHFVNEVAKEIPDKMISTLAYWYTRKAPDNIQVEPNVNIMLCNIESKRHRPVFETDSAFSTDLKNWGKIASDILIWDYNIQFSNLVSPFPNLFTIKPNLDFFIDNHVNAFYMQSNSQIGGEMAELRAYLISKLLWKPNADDQEIINDFLTGYYGVGGSYIRQYMDQVNEAMLASGFRLDIFGSPEAARDSYLSYDKMESYKLIFDQAEKAVENDAELLRRVRIARLPIMYAEIQISRTEVDTPRSMFKHDQNGRVYADPAKKKEITLFVERAKEQGVNRLRERSMTPDNYLESHNRIFTKLDEMDKAISYKKEVIAITIPSKPYRGIEALTDGIFGSYESWRDERFDNWLGYKGEHIDFILDLGEIKPIKSVNMDFFDAKDTYYTMALPEYVTYSTSTDGKSYTEAAKIVNPVDPNEPEIDSMPRVIYMQSFGVNLDNREARYIKVHAQSILKNPAWHVLKGSAVIMFTDEIVVN
ncbi:carbohydrate-binding protein [Bacteroidia bacterium]|nr:carbohydrate-binding protein [Bacteroidia bacterium]